MVGFIWRLIIGGWRWRGGRAATPKELGVLLQVLLELRSGPPGSTGGDQVQRRCERFDIIKRLATSSFLVSLLPAWSVVFLSFPSLPSSMPAPSFLPSLHCVVTAQFLLLQPLRMDMAVGFLYNFKNPTLDDMPPIPSLGRLPMCKGSLCADDMRVRLNEK